MIDRSGAGSAGRRASYSASPPVESRSRHAVAVKCFGPFLYSACSASFSPNSSYSARSVGEAAVTLVRSNTPICSGNIAPFAAPANKTMTKKGKTKRGDRSRCPRLNSRGPLNPEGRGQRDLSPFFPRSSSTPRSISCTSFRFRTGRHRSAPPSPPLAPEPWKPTFLPP